LELAIHSYRWAAEYLADDPDWAELRTVLISISREDVVARQRAEVQTWLGGGPVPPAGGQRVVNSIVEERLETLGWAGQQRVLEASETMPAWTIDFLKNQLGVEVSFNNAGALPQNMLRLSVRGESQAVPDEKKIRVGILVVAGRSLKDWSRMDQSVHTFDRVVSMLEYLRFAFPLPICIVGLDATEDGSPWPSTSLFAGRKLEPVTRLTEADRALWESIVSEDR
jgi:hypothetical protein